MRLGLNKKDASRASAAASETLRGFLRTRGLRRTAEREALLAAALARGSHFTLDELAQDVLRRDSSVSRATVFRAMPLLVEAGILQPAPIGGDGRRFELALGREHHDHLTCRGCGRIVEFRSEAVERLQVEVARRHGFRLASHVHELVGDCAACRASRAGAGADEAGARPPSGRRRRRGR